MSDDNYPVFNTGQPEEELPESVITLIGELIESDNVQSVSCPFNNSKVWRLLVAEQVRRAEQTGKPLQQAFTLAARTVALDLTQPIGAEKSAFLMKASSWRIYSLRPNGETLSVKLIRQH